MKKKKRNAVAAVLGGVLHTVEENVLEAVSRTRRLLLFFLPPHIRTDHHDSANNSSPAGSRYDECYNIKRRGSRVRGIRFVGKRVVPAGNNML